MPGLEESHQDGELGVNDADDACMDQDHDDDADDGEAASVTSSASSSQAGGASSQQDSSHMGGSFVMEQYHLSSQATSLASSSTPMGVSYFSSHSGAIGLGHGSDAMNDVSHSTLTASNIYLANQGQGQALPFRRPRQYSVGSTGSF